MLTFEWPSRRLPLIVSWPSPSEAFQLNELYRILSLLLWILEIAIIARALISWFDRGMQNPISQLLVQVTEPIIAPIRRVLPTAGSLDFSPIVAILAIFVLQRMLSVAVG